MTHLKLYTMALGIIATLSVLPTARAEHLMWDGDGYCTRSFNLDGGRYEVFLKARFPVIMFDRQKEQWDYFSGELDCPNGTISLGSAIPLERWSVPWVCDGIYDLPAGQYTL